MMRKSPDRSQRVTRHVPQRTCVACRQVKTKRELIRLVRIDDGRVEVDTSGRKAGRGAYLCNTPECWEVGLKRGRLEHVLRITLSRDNREELAEQGKAILRGDK